jgi:alpha-methylacyl-CoA racemase
VSGFWRDERGVNLLDSGAPFYDTYETKDGKYVAIGALEPQFYRALLEKLGLGGSEFENRMDRARWPALKQKFADVFRQKTRDEWDAIMLGSDVCYAPVLSLAEAPGHPHNLARQNFMELEGVVQPAPAPRFSGTVPEAQGPPRPPESATVLAAWGFSPAEIEAVAAAGAI